ILFVLLAVPLAFIGLGNKTNLPDKPAAVKPNVSTPTQNQNPAATATPPVDQGSQPASQPIDPNAHLTPANPADSGVSSPGPGRRRAAPGEKAAKAPDTVDAPPQKPAPSRSSASSREERPAAKPPEEEKKEEKKGGFFHKLKDKASDILKKKP